MVNLSKPDLIENLVLLFCLSKENNKMAEIRRRQKNQSAQKSFLCPLGSVSFSEKMQVWVQEPNQESGSGSSLALPSPAAPGSVAEKNSA